MLVGNVGTLFGGVRAFQTRPDDGELEVGVVTAADRGNGAGPSRVVAGRAGDSPFVETAPPRRSTFASTVRCFELDGGVRGEPAAPHRSATRSRHGVRSERIAAP